MQKSLRYPRFRRENNPTNYLTNYLLPILLLALALAAQLLLNPDHVALLYLPAVIVGAWMGGLGTGLAVTVISLLLSIALRVPLTTSVLIDLSLLVFNGILVSWLVYDSSAIQEQTMVKMQQDQSGLRFAISNTHAIVARVDTDLRYVWIQNPHPTFDPNEMIGKRDDELNPGTGSEKLMALKKRTLNSQMSHLERISFDVKGEHIVYDITAEPVMDEYGQVIGVTTVALDATEHERIRTQLGESEEQLRLAKRAAGLGLFDYFPERGLLLWDEKIRELWGFTTDEPITYQKFLSGVHPDDRAATNAAVERSLDAKGDSKYYAEYRVIHREDGSIRWIAATGQVTFQEGRAVRLIGTVQDVTEQKVAEQQLQTALNENASLADAVPHLVWTANSATDVDYYSTRVSNYRGITQNEDGSWSWEMSLHPDDRQQTVDAWQQAVEHNELYRCEHRLEMANGSFRWHLSLAKPAPTGSNGEIKWYGTSTDIHERKQVEEALRVSEEKYRTLFDLFSQGLCICEMLVDENGQPYDYRFLEVNDLFEAYTGLKDADGKTALELVPDLEPHWVDIYGKVALTGEALRFEQGSQAMGRWYDVYAFRIGDPDKFTFAIVFNDISTRKEQETMVREQGEILEQLINSLPVMITIYEPTNRVTYLNREFERLTGWRTEDAAEINLMERIYPDPEERAEAMTYMQSLEPGWRDFDLTARDGTNIRSSWANIRLSDGRQVGIGIDIRERERAEAHSRILRNLASSLSSVMTLSEISEIIIQKGIKVLGATGGTIGLLSEDGRNINFLATVGYSEAFLDEWQQVPVDHPTALLAYAVREGTPFWMENLEQRLKVVPKTPDLVREAQHEAWAVLPLKINNEVIGVIGLGYETPQTFDESEQNFISILTDYCAQALHRAILTEQLGPVAVAKERRRLSRDLHDSVKQLIFASMSIAQALPGMWRRDTERAGRYTDDVVALNRAALAELQTLLLELRPEGIIQTPFMTLVYNLCSGMLGRKEFTIDINYEGPEEFYFPPDTHVALYRIVQETLNNVTKHSNATHIDIDCAYTGTKFRLQIHDDGEGFATSSESKGFGLITMRERAVAIGANYTIESDIGEGTRTTVEWLANEDT